METVVTDITMVLLQDQKLKYSTSQTRLFVNDSHIKNVNSSSQINSSDFLSITIVLLSLVHLSRL